MTMGIVWNLDWKFRISLFFNKFYLNIPCGKINATMETWNYLIGIFTHLKLCLAHASHSFKWVKIIQIWQNGGQRYWNLAVWCHVLSWKCSEAGILCGNKNEKTNITERPAVKRLKWGGTAASGLLIPRVAVLRGHSICVWPALEDDHPWRYHQTKQHLNLCHTVAI